MKSSMKRKTIGQLIRIGPWLLFGSVLASGGAVGASGGLPIEVVKAERREVVSEQIFDALVEAVHESTVSAETSGRVMEINFDIGNACSFGDVFI